MISGSILLSAISMKSFRSGKDVGAVRFQVLLELVDGGELHYIIGMIGKRLCYLTCKAQATYVCQASFLGNIVSSSVCLAVDSLLNCSLAGVGLDRLQQSREQELLASSRAGPEDRGGFGSGSGGGFEGGFGSVLLLGEKNAVIRGITNCNCLTLTV